MLMYSSIIENRKVRKKQSSLRPVLKIGGFVKMLKETPMSPILLPKT